MHRCVCTSLLSLALTLAMTASSQAIPITYNLQPAEADSKDVFIYEGAAGINMDGGSFGAILGVANFPSPGPGQSGHSLKTLIQFDGLAALNLDPGTKVQSATLRLRVIDGTVLGFPFANPSTSAPITVDVFNVTSSWLESGFMVGASWNLQPTVGASAVSSEQLSGINQFLELDVTSLVQQWIDDPSSNHGLQLAQRDLVINGTLPVAAVFFSSDTTTMTGSESNRPLLSVLVPEPSSFVMAGLGCVGLVAAGLARRKGRLDGGLVRGGRRGA